MDKPTSAPMPSGMQCTELAELDALSRSDQVLREMLLARMPLDRETYLAMCWGPDLPDPWTAEHEAEVPPPFKARA